MGKGIELAREPSEANPDRRYCKCRRIKNSRAGEGNQEEQESQNFGKVRGKCQSHHISRVGSSGQARHEKVNREEGEGDGTADDCPESAAAALGQPEGEGGDQPNNQTGLTGASEGRFFKAVRQRRPDLATTLKLAAAAIVIAQRPATTAHLSGRKAEAENGKAIAAVQR